MSTDRPLHRDRWANSYKWFPNLHDNGDYPIARPGLDSPTPGMSDPSTSASTSYSERQAHLRHVSRKWPGKMLRYTTRCTSSTDLSSRCTQDDFAHWIAIYPPDIPISYARPAIASPASPPTPPAHLVDMLPDELWIEIMAHLDLPDLIALRAVGRRLSALALTPSLHRHLEVSVHAPRLSSFVSSHVLPHVRHLRLVSDQPRSSHIFLRPYHPPDRAALESLLAAIPDDQLLSFSLPNTAYAAPWPTLAIHLIRLGGHLEVLDASNSGLKGQSWIQCAKYIGRKGRGLRQVDLSHNPITALPQSRGWRSLERLALRHCTSIPAEVLRDYLAQVPPTLAELDLGGVQQLPVEALYGIRVVHGDGEEGEVRATALRTVRVVGIDSLTRSDIRAVQRHWAAQREMCATSELGGWSDTSSSSDTSSAFGEASFSNSLPASPEASPRPDKPSAADLQPRYASSPTTLSTGTGWRLADLAALDPHEQYPDTHVALRTATPPQNAIAIVHSALLETDDEAGYRQFIGEVVNGTIAMARHEFVC